MALNLDGLIPATVLPMDDDARIDEAALRAYIRWVVDQGPVNRTAGSRRSISQGSHPEFEFSVVQRAAAYLRQQACATLTAA